MFLQKLELEDFRNFSHYEIYPHLQSNLILGPNGVGKSSVLEAIYLLATGKSFKGGALQTLTRVGRPQSKIRAHLTEPEGVTFLEVQLQGAMRRVSINGSRVSVLKDFLGRVLVVSFSPDDLMLLKGGPALRRQLIDKHVVDVYPSSLAAYSNYNKALKQKLSLLKDGARPALLEPWNRTLAHSAYQIIRFRRRFCELLAAKLAIVYNDFITDTESVEVAYQSAWASVRSEDDVYRSLMTQLVSESVARRILVGPHLDDVSLVINGMSAKGFGSQGQLRGLALSLKLACAEILHDKTGRLPIVLLDDVDSELDLERRQRLFDRVLGKYQLFVAATQDADYFHKSGVGESLWVVPRG